MPDLTIRPAAKTDADALCTLWLAFLDEQAGFDDRFTPAADAQERWRNDFPDRVDDTTRRLFVAERDGAPVGFATAQLWASAPIYTYVKEVFFGELFVLPEHRRTGVGRKLAEAVQTWADEEEAGRLRLSVLSANEDGRAFWEGLDATSFSQTYTLELRAEQPSPEDDEREAARDVKLGF